MGTTAQAPNQVIPTSPNTQAAEIERLFQLQKANAQNIKNTSAADRKKKLRALERLIMKRKDDVSAALWADLHKAPAETDLVETYPVLSELRHAISHVSEWMRAQPVDTPMSFIGTSAKVILEPKGVSLVISPWNYPFQLCLAPLISVVAAGCTAIVKPSEYAPATATLVREMLAEIFPENEIAVVEGDHTVSTELLTKKFDHIHFTGSPNVGKIVMRAAAEHLTSVTLELGGKSPAVVDETANIAKTAKRLTWGKCVNAGQTCVAPDYLYVHESKYDALIAELKKNIKSSYGETEEDRKVSNDYSHIINGRHHSRLKKMLEDAIERGANIEIGGVVDDATNYFAPTILTNVSPDSQVMQDEIFGPILPVLKYSDLSEVLATINSKEKPLAMYIYTTKNKNIDKLVQHTSAGGTVVNDNLIHVGHPNLPFGGVNNSGIGSSHGFYGFKEFSHQRAFLHQPSWFSAAEGMFPPYTNTVRKLIELTMKFM